MKARFCEICKMRSVCLWGVQYEVLASSGGSVPKSQCYKENGGKLVRWNGKAVEATNCEILSKPELIKIEAELERIKNVPVRLF